MKRLISIFGLTSLAFTLLTPIADGAQPLIRSDCEKAGQAWNDRGNVCATSNEAIVSGKEKNKKKRKSNKDQSRLKPEPPEGVSTQQQ
jgi:hypothetical protein